MSVSNKVCQQCFTTLYLPDNQPYNQIRPLCLACLETYRQTYGQRAEEQACGKKRSVTQSPPHQSLPTSALALIQESVILSQSQYISLREQALHRLTSLAETPSQSLPQALHALIPRVKNPNFQSLKQNMELILDRHEQLTKVFLKGKLTLFENEKGPLLEEELELLQIYLEVMETIDIEHIEENEEVWPLIVAMAPPGISHPERIIYALLNRLQNQWPSNLDFLTETMNCVMEKLLHLAARCADYRKEHVAKHRKIDELSIDIIPEDDRTPTPITELDEDTRKYIWDCLFGIYDVLPTLKDPSELSWAAKDDLDDLRDCVRAPTALEAVKLILQLIKGSQEDLSLQEELEELQGYLNLRFLEEPKTVEL